MIVKYRLLKKLKICRSIKWQLEVIETDNLWQHCEISFDKDSNQFIFYSMFLKNSFEFTNEFFSCLLTTSVMRILRSTFHRNEKQSQSRPLVAHTHTLTHTRTRTHLSHTNPRLSLFFTHTHTHTHTNTRKHTPLPLFHFLSL